MHERTCVWQYSLYGCIPQTSNCSSNFFTAWIPTPMIHPIMEMRSDFRFDKGEFLF